jgi:hypothetical protein
LDFDIGGRENFIALAIFGSDFRNLPIAQVQPVSLKTLQQGTTRPFAWRRVVCGGSHLDGRAEAARPAKSQSIREVNRYALHGRVDSIGVWVV